MSTQARSTYTRSLHPPTPYMQAVSAYLKSGDVKSAVDSCVRDHHWEVAVQLAETHNYPDIQKVRTPRHSPLNLHPDPIPSPGPSPNPHPNLHPDPHLALTLLLPLTRYSRSTPRTCSPRGSSCTRSSSTARPSSTPRPPSCSASWPRRAQPLTQAPKPKPQRPTRNLNPNPQHPKPQPQPTHPHPSPRRRARAASTRCGPRSST